MATRIAVAEERARIARELHDVVAHAVSVMVLQVGAVRHRLPQSLSEDREALQDVEKAGRAALAECATSSARCVTARMSSLHPSRASTAWTPSSSRSAGPAARPAPGRGRRRRAPARSRTLCLPNRAGGADQFLEARQCEPR